MLIALALVVVVTCDLVVDRVALEE